MGTIPVKPPFKKIELAINYKDGFSEGSKYFASVQELSAFLKDNTEFAKALGYIDKKK